MCELKPIAQSKVDILIKTMERLTTALEGALDRDILHGELHRDAGGLRTSGSPTDYSVGAD